MNKSQQGAASLKADPIRRSFVARFGEAEAKTIEDAAQSHYATDEAMALHVDLATLHGSDDFGSSPFRYWFLLAIARECVTRFRGEHGITTAEDDLRKWALAEGKLADHDGDLPDYIALVFGSYRRWVVNEDE